MAEITRKRTGEFLHIVFNILSKNQEGLPAREVLNEVASRVKMSEYEAGEYDSGGQRFEKIIRFATVDCVKAGWLLKNKGRWMVTENGIKAALKFKDPESFYKEAIRLYRVWKKSQLDDDLLDEKDDEFSEGKATRITFEQAEEQSWTEIEHFLHNMQPYDFQELVAGLLRAMGYYVTWIAPPGKDGGIDIIAHVDPLGTKPPRIKIQVKRQNNPTRVEDLRSFMAVLGDLDVGLYVSIGGFTKDTVTEARMQEKRKITLINLETLFDLWIEHYHKLSDEARKLLPLKPIYFLAPNI